MEGPIGQLFVLCENIPLSPPPDRALALVRTPAGDYELHSWHCDYDEPDWSDPEERKGEEVRTIKFGVAMKLLKELRSLSLPLSDFPYHGDRVVFDGGSYKLTVGDGRGGLTCFWEEDPESFLRENFSRVAFAARLRGERSLVPEDVWEARLMLFVLCRWAFFSEDGNQQDPFEFDDNVLSRIFALLYLRLYRKGLDASHLTRSQFRKDWEAIPFAEKEAYAAKCRSHLLKTRNEMWECRG